MPSEYPYDFMSGAAKLTAFSNHNGTVTVKGKDPFSGASHSVTVPLDGFERWRFSRAPIQDALPTVSADDREFLISGLTPETFDSITKEDDDLGICPDCGNHVHDCACDESMDTTLAMDAQLDEEDPEILDFENNHGQGPDPDSDAHASDLDAEIPDDE